MPIPLGAALFWIAVVSVVASQVMILRSTRRALRAGGGRSPALEWGFAVAPAAGLAILLLFSWRAATRPPVMEMEFTPAAGEIRS
jgi:hypothetical protein